MVRWYWWDDNTWVEYSQELIDKLERAWNKDYSEVKIDDDRFVDIQNMCQRRYDDPQKKRGVKRESLPFLDYVFLNLGEIDKKLLTIISNAGGLITPFYHKKITHILMDKNTQNNELIDLAKSKKIPILDINLLNDKITTKDIENIHLNDFLLNLDKIEKKIEKKIESSNINFTDIAIRSNIPADSGFNNTEWLGVAVHKASEHKFPIILTIFFQNPSGKFWGQINWPTKLNSLTKVTGEFTDKKISLKETQLISGEIELFELPCSYEGILVHEDQIRLENDIYDIQITLLGQTTDIPYPFLTPGVSLDGICTEQLSYNLEITSQKGKNCEANLKSQNSLICPSETASSLLTEQDNITLRDTQMEEVKVELSELGLTQFSIRPLKSGIEIIVNK